MFSGQRQIGSLHLSLILTVHNFLEILLDDLYVLMSFLCFCYLQSRASYWKIKYKSLKRRYFFLAFILSRIEVT